MFTSPAFVLFPICPTKKRMIALSASYGYNKFNLTVGINPKVGRFFRWDIFRFTTIEESIFAAPTLKA